MILSILKSNCRRTFVTSCSLPIVLRSSCKPLNGDGSAKLSENDPNSFSNPDSAVVTDLSLSFLVDFSKKILVGEAKLHTKKVQEDSVYIDLDCDNLHIKEITDSTGTPLEYKVSEPIKKFGSKLSIKLPSGQNEVDISVKYETDPKAFALQWMTPEQTAGRKHPYLVSQCAMTHSRSIVPCQDTPSVKMTYTAEITAPAELTALMSALRDGVTEPKDGLRTYSFKQPVPIPSYLLALVVGDLVSKQIGPRSHVWSEPQLIDKAALEFSETEQFLQTAESMGGPYVWGVCDLLVLPPSFSYGGMENPCLAYLTPTILAGDRSLTNTVIHEIAHSWTGNLVTNRNWEHFWLNEGLNTYFERQIIGRLYGEQMREFAAISGLKQLKDDVTALGENSPLTKMVLDLSGGISPDDDYSSCPYEKGHTFLFYLEQHVGGPDVFDPFFKAYIDKFKYKSIETKDFKDFFESYFAKNPASKTVEWDKWLYSTGMPFKIPKYDTTLQDACTALVERWEAWDSCGPVPFSPEDFSSLKPLQIQEVLDQMLLLPGLPLAKVKAMQSNYKLDESNNAEIKYRWLRLCLKAKWEDEVPNALQFVNAIGRMKYVRPIYRDLYAWEKMRQRAIDNFKANRANMMSVTAYSVAKDLHLDKA